MIEIIEEVPKVHPIVEDEVEHVANQDRRRNIKIVEVQIMNVTREKIVKMKIVIAEKNIVIDQTENMTAALEIVKIVIMKTEIVKM